MSEVFLEVVVFCLIVVACYALVRAWRTPTVSRALTALLGVYFVLFYCVPIFLSVALWGQLPSRIADENDFLRLAALDTGLIATIVLCFTAWKTPSQILRQCAFYSTQTTSLVVFCTALAAVGTTTYLYLTEGFGVGYLERNAFAVKAAGSDNFNTIGPISYAAQLFFCFVCAALVTRSTPALPKWLRAVLVVVVLWWTYTQLALGSRLGLLMPVELFILYAVFQKWTRARFYTFALITGPALVIAVSLVTIVVQDTRARSTNAVEGTNAAIGSRLESASAISDLTQKLTEALVRKTDSYSTGVLLLTEFGPGDGGLNPYFGALLALVPRSLYPDKPVPGSRDGTYSGHPSRFVARRLGMSAEEGNVGVSPASVTIWQLGYGNLLLLIVANVINLRILNVLFLSPSIVARAIALAVITPPALIGLIATPDVHIMNWQRLAIVLVAFDLTDRIFGKWVSRRIVIPERIRLISPALRSPRADPLRAAKS